MYKYENYKKYQEKIKKYSVKYSLSESDAVTTAALEEAIKDSNLPANRWIKQAILEKLVKDQYLT